MKRTYKWRYRKGNTLHSFSLEFAFPYSAYSAFTDPKFIRNSLGKNQIPFTVVTDEIKRLSDQLRKRYIKTFRSDPTVLNNSFNRYALPGLDYEIPVDVVQLVSVIHGDDHHLEFPIADALSVQLLEDREE